MAVDPDRQSKRSRFGVADLVVLIAGIALALALPIPMDLIELWEPGELDWWVGRRIACEGIARTCLAMIPLLLWRSGRQGRTLRAAELLMVAIAAPLLADGASTTGVMHYVFIPRPDLEAKYFKRYPWDGGHERLRDMPDPEVYSNWSCCGAPSPSSGHYAAIEFGDVVPSPEYWRFLAGVWTLCVASLAARVVFRRRLSPWGASALMVAAVLTSTPWASDPLTFLLLRRLGSAGLRMSAWGEGVWRLLDAFKAVVPTLFAISAIRDLVRDRRGMAPTQWIGLALGMVLFVVCEIIQFQYISSGGEHFNDYGSALGVHFTAGMDDYSTYHDVIPFSVILTLFLLVPLVSTLIALLISATFGPTWRRWTASGYDSRGAAPNTPEA